MRLRLIVPVLLVLAVTAIGFALARIDTGRDAHRESQHRADIAATQLSGGLEQATNLMDSLRQLMLGRPTNAEFADVGARWLGPVGLSAAAWIKEPPPGNGPLRAALVSGASPMSVPGAELGAAALRLALRRSRTLFRVTATPLVRAGDGDVGVFLVQAAPRLAGGILEPGYVVMFVPGSWLVAEATREAKPQLQVRIGRTSYGSVGKHSAVDSSFTAAGRRFEVLIPRQGQDSSAAALPWIVLAGGLVLAALAGGLAVIAARRKRAQREIDRLFGLSADLIVVSGFDGAWKRVNPAFQKALGFAERELVGRRLTDFIHPDDRERSAAETRRVIEGEATFAFENRMLSRDGSYRWIEWTATAGQEERALYGVGRDVTERRRSESEETALRRVATLAAENTQPNELFAAVAEEVSRVFDVPVVSVIRYEPDGTATDVANFSRDHALPASGRRWSLDGPSVVQLVRSTRDVARIDDYEGLESQLADAARQNGMVSTVGAPIIVAGELWGTLIVSSTDEPLAEGTETRLADFTELLATAIASAESHEALARLVDEQAALRRVATLVAQEASTEDLFASVVEEVGRLLPVSGAAMGRFDPDDMITTIATWTRGGVIPFPAGQRWPAEGLHVTGLVMRTGQPARLDDFSEASGPIGRQARKAGYRSAVGSPITVEGRLWGAMTASSTAEEPLPPETETRLASFTELLATAIANAESRAALEHLADEQSALRRLALLVAEGTSPAEIFSAVSQEVAELFGSDIAGVVKFGEDEGDPYIDFVGVSKGVEGAIPNGTRWKLEDALASAHVYRTGRSNRVDKANWAEVGGVVAQAGERLGIASTVSSPIHVEGRLWGAATVSHSEPLPADAEQRLAKFAGIVATAIANAESRAEVERLAEEQAALRRVATLVAEGPEPQDLFSVMADEVASVIDVPGVWLLRYDPGRIATVIGTRGGSSFPAGSQWPLDGPSVTATVYETGRPARIDDLEDMPGAVAAEARAGGITSAVGTPITVAGRTWGTVIVATTEPQALPADTVDRLSAFTQLIETAVANAESRTALERLAEEQVALRRVATLVAEGAREEEIFACAAREVANAFGVTLVSVDRYESDSSSVVVATGEVPWFPVGSRWPLDGPCLAQAVRETGRPARVDDYTELDSTVAAAVRASPVKSTVGVPILVDGRPWGVISIGTTESVPLAEGIEAHLADFTELLATAIARAESRRALAEVAEEQAALRRVATLVAQGVAPAEILSAVTDEVGRLFGSDAAAVARFDHEDPGIVFVGLSNRMQQAGSRGPRLPHRWDVADESLGAAEVYRTGRSARVEERHWSRLGGPMAEASRDIGVVSSVACPIVVDGRPWGAVSVSSTHDSLPLDTEARLEKFTDLVATAIANTESREALRRLVDEQATLRRIATLVAQGVEPATIFSAVSDDVAAVFGVEIGAVVRFDDEGPALVYLGVSQASGIPFGTRWGFEEGLASPLVYRTGRSARVDAMDWSSGTGPAAAILGERGVQSSVAVPIVVEGRLWGSLVVSSTTVPLPLNAEERLERFTELVATAIANAESRDALAGLVEEQATLRRIATLVAQGLEPQEIFAAVAKEIAASFGGVVVVQKFEPGGQAAVRVGGSADTGVPDGTRWEFADGVVTSRVYRSGRSVRVDGVDWSSRSGDAAATLERLHIASQVGSPIVVGGEPWGAIILNSTDQLPSDTEERLERFTELVATAVANAESKSELAASRRRIVTAADVTRREIERNLHDGTQQRLVSLGLAVRAAEANLPPDRQDLREELSRVATGLSDAIEDLQEFSRGIHPAILSKGGLAPALRTLASRSPIAVNLEIETDARLPEAIEVAAYFVASEALANAAKYSQGSRIDLSLEQRNGSLLLSIRDDGVGGADPTGGSGLLGLSDRVEALGGSIRFSSRPGEGTRLTAELPLDLESPSG